MHVFLLLLLLLRAKKKKWEGAHFQKCSWGGNLWSNSTGRPSSSTPLPSFVGQSALALPSKPNETTLTRKKKKTKKKKKKKISFKEMEIVSDQEERNWSRPKSVFSNGPMILSSQWFVLHLTLNETPNIPQIQFNCPVIRTKKSPFHLFPLAIHVIQSIKTCSEIFNHCLSSHCLIYFQ